MLETTICNTRECDTLGGNAMLEVALVASTTCDEEYTVIVTASDVTTKGEADIQTVSIIITSCICVFVQLLYFLNSINVH